MSKYDRIKKKRKEALKKEQLELLKEQQEEKTPDLTEETVEKDYGMGEVMPMQMMPGPTSWDELDAQDMAEDQAEEVQETTWDVYKLVNNILCHPEMSPDDKAAAMSAVAEGFAPRVNDILSNADEPSMAQKEVDMDLLEAESLLAEIDRHTGTLEKVEDIVKRVLSYGARKNLPAGEFALPEKRKYPIHDKAHVRNALARAAQQMKGGGAGAADARAAMPKIREAAKKMGIMVSKEHDSILIEKDAAGDWRWVGWPTNNFIDRSEDIITEAAHLEFVEWVNKDLGHRGPVFTSLHAPGTYRENPVDFVGYQNGFLVASGKLTESEAAGLMEVQKEHQLGMSHTSWGLRDAQDPRQIVKYRMFEVTDLPLEMADNPFTNLETISKEADMDQKQQLEYLTKLLGSEARAKAALEDKTSLKQKELAEAQVESKEVAETPKAETPAPVTEPTPAPVITDALVKQIEDQLGLKDLAVAFTAMQKDLEKIPVLEQLVTDLSKSKDDMLAEALTPEIGKFPWMTKNRSSQKEETKVKEDDPILKSKPKPNWLTDALGVEPVSITEE